MNEGKRQQKRKALRYKSADMSDSVLAGSAGWFCRTRTEPRPSSGISPAGGAVVSAWPSPRVARWGATLRGSSAEGSHKEARSIRSSGRHRNQSFQLLAPGGDTFKALPVVWATEGIRRSGTGIVETSGGFRINISMKLAASQVVNEAGADSCTWTGLRGSWGPLAAFGSCGCSSGPLGGRTGVS